MTVSVALATYNGSKYLLKQLNSLKNQTRKIDEVIICDDCSKDDTVTLIKSYIKENCLENWKVYQNSENLGYKRNFKEAISKTTGEIVFLCDQDDIWEKDKIEKMTYIFESQENISVLFSSFDFIDENDNSFCKKEKKNTSNHSLIKGKLKKNSLTFIDIKTLLKSNISPGCTGALRRKIADFFCKKSSSLLHHDWEIAFIGASQNALAFYNCPLIKYRIHSSNALGLESSVRGRVNIAKEKFDALDTLCLYGDFKKEKEIFEKRYNFLKNKEFFSLVKLLIKSKIYRKYFSLKEITGDLLFAKK